MTHIISLSGGIASAISAIACHENGIPYHMVFADTLIEDDDLYRFIKDLSAALGKPIVWLKDGRTPWDVFLDIGFMGNSRIAQCSRILKTEVIKKWVDENCAPSDPLVLGMDWSESDRIERAQKNWAPRPVVSILNELQVRRPTYAAILAKYGITPPRLYEFGFPHNNCAGACVRAGQTQWATLLERFPSVYIKHENEQNRIMAINPKLRPFLRKNYKGKEVYFTLQAFRLLVQLKIISVDLFDWGGCGCFIDDVEATK